MLDEFDRKEITDLIAEKFDLLSAFKGLDVGQLEQLGQDIEGFLYSRQRALRKPKNTYTPRWLLGGNDINSIEYAQFDQANVAGHAGPTLPQIINLDSASFQARLKQGDPNELQIKAVSGAGADCLFDYLVSSCFATLSGFTEGQTFTSLSGCTFKGYSTIQGALTAAGALSANDSSTIAICSGTYTETLTRTDVSNASLTLLGTGQGNVIVKPATGSGPIFTIPTQSLTNNNVGISGITFDTSGMNSGSTAISCGGGQRIKINNCQINVASAADIGINPGNSAAASVILSQVNFTGSGIGVQTASSAVLSGFIVNQCSFESGMALGVHMRGQVATVTSSLFGSTIGVQLSGAGAIQAVNVSGNMFESCTTGIKFTTANGASDYGFTFAANAFIGCTVGIDLTTLTNNAWGFAIDGNSFVAGTTGVKLHATRVMHSVISGNTFSGPYAVGSEISGMTQAQMITADTQVCHNATDSGTAITEYGIGHVSSGTGGAAPNNAQYLTLATDATLTSERVFTPGNGLINGATDAGAGSTYTLALKDLNANWTQAGVFDISTAGNLTVLKHVAVGALASIDAASILNFSESFTDPAATSFGIQGLLTKVMTSANAQDTVAVKGTAAVSGNFNDTGITAGFLSIVQRLTAAGGQTSSDFRNYRAQAIVGTGKVVTDRYGLHVEDATGSGTLTTQTGVFLANLAKGGTNWAFRTLGGKSYHQGSLQIGGASAGSAAVSPSASAILDLTNVANLALLLPAIATASLPAGVNGLLVYDSTTNTIKGYVNGAYVSVVTAEHHTISAQVDVTVASTTVPYQVVGPMSAAGTITGVEAKTGENKTNGATSAIFDVHKILAASADTDGQGTTIFTTQGNRPTISNTHMLSTTTAPDVTAFAAGDYFSIYTDQSGTSLTVANVGVKYTIP